MNATQSTTKNVAAQQRSEPRLPRKALLAALDDRKTVLAMIQRRPYTMVSISSWYNKKEYSGVGFSKVCYPDVWDGEQGADIAVRRALIDIFHQVRWDEDVDAATESLTWLTDKLAFEFGLGDDPGERLLDEIPF